MGRCITSSHDSCADGCGTGPITGFRWKCKGCKARAKKNTRRRRASVARGRRRVSHRRRALSPPSSPQNHDICDSCHDYFKTQGKLLVSPEMARVNRVSPKAEDHSFYAHAEAGAFQKMAGAGGGAGGSSVTEKKEAKAKPNDPCPCGSGKKFKKCCAVAK